MEVAPVPGPITKRCFYNVLPSFGHWRAVIVFRAQLWRKNDPNRSKLKSIFQLPGLSPTQHRFHRLPGRRSRSCCTSSSVSNAAASQQTAGARRTGRNDVAELLPGFLISGQSSATMTSPRRHPLRGLFSSSRFVLTWLALMTGFYILVFWGRAEQGHEMAL